MSFLLTILKAFILFVYKDMTLSVDLEVSFLFCLKASESKE